MTPDSKKRRFRTAPPVWRKIIKSIVDDAYDGRAITYEMIERVVKEQNHSITRDSLRVKMARYIKSGYINPAKDVRSEKRLRGAFWLTPEGQVFFGLTSRTKQSKEQKTAVLPTPPSKWELKALSISQAVTTAR